MNKRDEVLQKAISLINAYYQGELGGETMPEDKNPVYPENSRENYLYFTLPMALNYQRNSYKLWESALATVEDSETADVFKPTEVLKMSENELREKLVKHKIALQPNKQPEIWRKLCETFARDFRADVREFLQANHQSVSEIKNYMLSHKKDFPYLSGNKIMNYWLYVLANYTDLQLIDRENISVAPDTNVIQASVKLGLISDLEAKSSKA